MPLSVFPKLNAGLNAASALSLTAGYLFIRRRNVAAHKACMLTAFALSCLFLASYLYYHAHAGSVRFPGAGLIRKVYLSILLSHTVLAAAVVPLVLRALWLAWKERFDLHARAARWALPVWLYVSVTGVVVYAMLYAISWG